MFDDVTVIDTEKMSLEEWLELLYSFIKNDILFIDYMFPTDEIRDSYLKSIDKFSESEVKKLIHNFLIPSCSLHNDQQRLISLIDYIKNNPDKAEKIKDLEFFKRCIIFAKNKGEGRIQPWEGITWVLDLIPMNPRCSIDVIYAYIAAHAQLLPDGRLSGLSDALAVIRAKFIEATIPGNAFSKFDSREFEHIVESAYHSMGYNTILTKESRDGGKDIIAVQEEIGKQERVFIECKNWDKNVGVKEVRSLLGVVNNEKASRGIVVSSSGFSKPAQKFAYNNDHIELIDGDKLQKILNKYLGTDWTLHADYYIMSSKERN